MSSAMLDHSNPFTKIVFRASELLDGVMLRAHEMTLSPSAIRYLLLRECLPLLADMRKLNTDHYKSSVFISENIDAFELAVRKVAALGDGQIVEDRRDGKGNCPHCNTVIQPISEFSIWCRRCSMIYMPAKMALACLEGFGTDAI